MPRFENIAATCIVILSMVASTRADVPGNVDYPPGLVDNSPEVIARQVAMQLAADYAYLATAPETELPGQVAALVEHLTRLSRMEANIPASASPEIRAPALRARARAWLNGWAAWNRAVMRLQAGPAVSWEMLVGADESKPSAWVLLLSSYQHVVDHAAEVGASRDRPLDVVSGNRCDECALLVFRPASPDGNVRLPSTADLRGRPVQPDSPGMGGLTLWGLITLQLGRPAATIQDQLVHAHAWISKLRHLSSLTAIDDGSARPWLERLEAYLQFRLLLLDGGTSSELIEEIKAERLLPAGSKQRSIPLKASQALESLKTAAAPVGMEHLSDAAIWLRYMFLVSYRNDGLAAMFDDAGGVTSAWKTFFPADPDFTAALVPGPETRVGETAFTLTSVVRYPPPTAFTRAIADVASATFHVLKAQWTRLSGDSSRAQMFRLNTARADVSNRISNAQGDIETALELLMPHLARRTGGGGLTFTVGENQWSAAATGPEIEQISEDVVAVAQIAAALERQHHAALQTLAEDPAKNDARAALAAMAQLSSLQGWDVAAYPAADWESYRQQATDSLKALGSTIDQSRERDEARREVARKLDIYKKALNDAMAAVQSAELKKRAVVVAEQVVRVSKIDIEIAQLETEITAMKLDAATISAKAAAVAWQRAFRLQALAEARVQALNAAVANGRDLVEQAKREIEAQRGSILEAARGLESEASREHLFGLIKGIVTIVGVALAPFTGGASLTAAAIASNVITVVQVSTDKNRWRDPASATNAMLAIVGKTTGSIEVGLRAWGSPQATQEFSAFRQALLRRGADVESLVASGQKIYDHIKNKDDFWKISACLAQNFPVKMTRNGAKIGIASEEIAVKLPGGLDNAFSEVLRQGGYLQSQAQKISSDFDATIERERSFLEISIRQLPNQVLQQTGLNPAKVNDQFNQAKERFIKAYEFLSPEDQANAYQVLAQLHDTGAALFMAADGRVHAVQRDLVQEIAGLRDEIERITKNVANDAIGKAVARVTEARNKLQGNIRDAQQARDPEQLRAIAERGIPAALDETSDALKEMEAKLDEATSEAKTRQSDLDIAVLQNQSAEILEEVSRKEASGASLALSRTQQSLEIAMGLSTIATGEEHVVELMLGSSLRAIEIARDDLLYAVERARADGFDPFDSATAGGAPSGARRLLASLGVSPHNQQLWGLTSATVGLIQWIAVLQPDWRNLTTKSAPMGLYKHLLDCTMKLAGQYPSSASGKRCFEDLLNSLDSAWEEVSQNGGISDCASAQFEASRLKWQSKDGKSVTEFSMRLGYDQISSTTQARAISQGLDPRFSFYAVIYPNTPRGDGRVGTIFAFRPIMQGDSPVRYKLFVEPPAAACPTATSALPVRLPALQAEGSLQESLEDVQAINSLSAGFFKEQRGKIGLRPAEGDWKIRIEAGGSPPRQGTFTLRMLCLLVSVPDSSLKTGQSMCTGRDLQDGLVSQSFSHGVFSGRPNVTPSRVPLPRGCSCDVGNGTTGNDAILLAFTCLTVCRLVTRRRFARVARSRL